MQTTFKRIAAALLISLSLGLSGTAMAQAIAPTVPLKMPMT